MSGPLRGRVPRCPARGVDCAGRRHPEQGRRLIDTTLADFGRIDVWVNNPGVSPEVRLDWLDLAPTSWDRVLGINLRGSFFLTQAVARAMIDLIGSGTVQAPYIHSVTSVSSTFASANLGEYCVAKAGLSMVAQIFADRLADDGINIYEVRPRIIATDLTGPVGEVDDRRIAEGLTPVGR
jgi:NAD(P)-dependent dehydrogenase (short-subunit alcohol dehydrogenase family)